MRKESKKISNKTIGIILCLIFSGMIVLGMIGNFNQGVFAATLSGWQHRKSITLSRASGAITNYQMKLLVGESSGATGEDVDCASHVQADFDDLRFTTSDGVTLLDYWIESISGTTPNQLATVWIEFDNIGTSATTFYMYYGNSSATAYSNGNNTFVFFDNAESGIITDKWSDNAGGGSKAYSTDDKKYGSYGIKIVQNNPGSLFLVANKNYWDLGNFRINFWLKQNDLAQTLKIYLNDSSGASAATHGYGYPGHNANLSYYNGSSYVDTNYDLTASWINYEYLCTTSDDKIVWKKDNTIIAADSKRQVWGLMRSINLYGEVNAGETYYIDNFFVANYAANEPAWGSWGSQETLNISVTLDPISFDFGPVPIGSSSNFNLKVTNSGGTTVSGALILNGPFTCGSECSYTATSGNFDLIPVRFEPTVEGDFTITGILSVSGGQNINIPLEGTGMVVSSCQDHNVWGYAWSQGIGWISFSCKNENATADYGIDIDNNDPTADEWLLSGYAWSENIGWITFNQNELINCPIGSNCYAWVDANDGTLYGWARACSVFESGCSGVLKNNTERGGWDGWMGFYQAGIDSNVSPAEFTGYIWGGDVNVGGVSLNHENQSNSSSNYVVQTSITVNGKPTVIFTKDPDDNDNYCGTIDGQGMINFEWQYSDDENMQTSFDFRISSISDPTNYIVERLDYAASCADTEPPILCTNTQAAYVGDELEYDTTYSWEVQVHNSENSSGWLKGGGSIGTFTTASHSYPWVDFTWDPDAPLINELTTFDSSSSTIYGSSPSYLWQFSTDAVPSSSSRENPTTTFTTGGDKNITLTISDSAGSCSKTKTMSATLPLPDWTEIPPE